MSTGKMSCSTDTSNDVVDLCTPSDTSYTKLFCQETTPEDDYRKSEKPETLSRPNKVRYIENTPKNLSFWKKHVWYCEFTRNCGLLRNMTSSPDEHTQNGDYAWHFFPDISQAKCYLY